MSRFGDTSSVFGWVVAYARTSSDGQARLGTIQAQKDELPKTAARVGFEIKQWVIDDGLTGRLLDGRKLKQLLEDIRDGAPVTAIFAVDLDRLMRPKPTELQSAMDWAFLCWVLSTRNVPVIDAQGRVIHVGTTEEKIRSSLATEQLDKIEENTKRGRRTAASLNRPAYGLRPYGYRWVKVEGPRRGRWEIHDEHAAIVVWAFESYLSGMGAPRIAQLLNERGVATPMKAREANKHTNGKRKDPEPPRWHAGTLLTLMKNRAYVGRWSQRVGDQTYVSRPIEEVSEAELANGYAPMPRLVSDDTFERAQARMEGRGNRRPPQKMTTPLLSGCATCGHCGYAVVSTSAKLAGGLRKARYTCGGAQRRYTQGIPGGCELRTFNAEEIDEIIWARISRLLLNSEALAVAASLQDEASDAKTIDRELRSLEAKLKRYDDEVQKLITRQRRGLITEDQLDGALSNLAKDRQMVQRNRDLVAARLEKSRRAEAVTRSVEATLDRLRGAVRQADPKTRNEILRALCPTSDFGLVLRREADVIEFSGRICLEVAEGAQLAVEVA